MGMTVRRIVHNDTSVEISEHDWARLLSMFDARKAIPNIFGYNCIHVDNICVARNHKCTRCTLGIMFKRPNGCVQMFTEMIGKDLCEYLYLFDKVVMWSACFDSEAREALRIVKDVLSKATKISK